MRLRLALSLAWASLWHRRRVLALVTLTLTLSVTLLLGVQYLRTEVRQSFSNTISGTDLIVGARSGQLNLLLYTVFHIGDATNNIRWSTYQGLTDDARIDWVVPLSLGDSYRGHRVVGTDRGFVEHFRFGREEALSLSQGEWFGDVFDVVLGADVARQHQHALEDELILSHGGGRTSFSNHKDTPFTVTGILAPTGTPVDQAVYISLEGMEAMHIGWQSGVAIPGRTVTREEARKRDLTPSSITAALVGIERKVMTFQVQRQINEFRDEPLSAVLPGVALSELWRIMGQFERALLGITGFVVVTSLIGLIAVLLTLQAQRGREIAILRATGASPSLVAALHVIECVTLAAIACLLALALSAGGLALISPWLLENHGIQIGLRPLAPTEWLILATVPATAALVGLIPALQAWRQSRHHGLSHGSDG
ncbi:MULTISPECIES: ABC transporter permease [Marinobacter]|jgi:putative ABC transport system permease protein|uniref:ABC transporter permease n=1 Tax=Marinobacter TaxID=2742 RepID=UPI00200389C7|nr:MULTISPECIES: ABC transporter permease [Marinobacter]MCK7550351.1 ABC transporter permease [Marinobacter goseongensis]MDV3502443.1 ABC transporter permease [Marinobacter sp. M-5]